MVNCRDCQLQISSWLGGLKRLHPAFCIAAPAKKTDNFDTWQKPQRPRVRRAGKTIPRSTMRLWADGARYLADAAQAWPKFMYAKYTLTSGNEKRIALVGWWGGGDWHGFSPPFRHIEKLTIQFSYRQSIPRSIYCTFKQSYDTLDSIRRGQDKVKFKLEPRQGGYFITIALR